MFFQRFYDSDLAQASYMLGCQKTGECVVIDPVRDISAYLAEAQTQRLRVTHVTETHIHADFLSGSRELAHATGATLLLSAEGGPDWLYTFPGSSALRGGDTFAVGHLRVDVRHTPGHTPESLSFVVTDTPRSDEPALLLSGDFVFVGDVGRPDLLDEAAGGQDTRFAGARQLFASLRDTFLTLPDHVQVWPGHGSGSGCGKALGAAPCTTVGYERVAAWWAPHVRAGDEAAFTAELLAGQPDAPLYYGRMKRQNRAGPALLEGRGQAPLPRLTPGDLPAQVTLIDTRPAAAHQAGAPGHSVSVPAGNTFETWAGWLLRPERAPYVLLAGDAAAAEALRRRLWMVGLDEVTGFLPAGHLEGPGRLETTPTALISAPELARRGAFLLDVRKKTEYDAGHLPGATQRHAGRLPWTLDDLPRDREIVVYCQSGARSAAAASLLRAEGFPHVTELAGGYEAWAAAQENH